MPQGLHLLAPRNTEDFLLVPLHCPRGYISSPPETLRTFSLSRLHPLDGEEVFISCLYIAPGVTSSRPQKHGGLLLFLACTRSTARRSLFRASTLPQGLHLLAPRNMEDFYWCLYIAPGVTSSRPQKHGGLFTLPRLHSLDGEEVFISPQNARGR